MSWAVCETRKLRDNCTQEIAVVRKIRDPKDNVEPRKIEKMEKKSGGIAEKHRNIEIENTEITDYSPANFRKILNVSMLALNSPIDDGCLHSEEFLLNYYLPYTP